MLRPSIQSVDSAADRQSRSTRRPRHSFGNGRAHAEPVRRPERAQALAELRRPVVERSRFLERDAIDRPRDQQLVGRAQFGVDEVPQTFRRLRQTGAGVLRMADHVDGEK